MCLSFFLPLQISRRSWCRLVRKKINEQHSRSKITKRQQKGLKNVKYRQEKKGVENKSGQIKPVTFIKS